MKETEALLTDLLNAYWEGLMKPIHFFPFSSWKYSEELSKGKDRRQAMTPARSIWEGNDFSRGEIEDSYYQVCFEHGNPLDEEFERLSKIVFRPLIDCEEKIKNA